MRFHAFWQELVAAIVYIGLFYMLYPLLNMIIVGMTLYAAYFTMLSMSALAQMARLLEQGRLMCC
jgi:hypothetical protein